MQTKESNNSATVGAPDIMEFSLRPYRPGALHSLDLGEDFLGNREVVR
jgi:hypothetical protein